MQKGIVWSHIDITNYDTVPSSLSEENFTAIKDSSLYLHSLHAYYENIENIKSIKNTLKISDPISVPLQIHDCIIKS